MVRKATSTTKGHTTRQKAAPAPVAEELPAQASRRGRKPKPRDAQPTELSLADMFSPGGGEAASEPLLGNDDTAATSTEPAQHSEPTAGSQAADDASNGVADATPAAAPAKARRGRPSKVQPVSEPEATANAGTPLLDALTEPMEPAVSSIPANTADGNDADDTTNAPPIKARRGRPRKTQPVAQSPEPEVEQRMGASVTEAVSAELPEVAIPGSSEPSAASWDAVTGMATFDWPAIEQVAGTPGPNQAMAKLLLAARAEGANSRWPF